MNSIKAIIFDLDGTLINSIGGIGFSMNSVLEKNGMPTHPIDTYKTFVGNGIDRLVKRSISLAINTNKVSRFLQPIIDKYLTQWTFSCIIGGTSLNSLKPDPEGALHILHTFGISPKECIYVGESEIDIATAKNAGICSVSVAWGFRSESDLITAGAQNIIRHPR